MKDGGPAFPSTFQNYKGDYVRDAGMSLRDYFAGQAVTGWLATAVNLSSETNEAKQAYKLADAMLKERNK